VFIIARRGSPTQTYCSALCARRSPAAKAATLAHNERRRRKPVACRNCGKETRGRGSWGHPRGYCGRACFSASPAGHRGRGPTAEQRRRRDLELDDPEPPTLSQIKQACLSIQNTWTAEELRLRVADKRGMAWRLPGLPEGE
jgi:hypothetical protein